MAIDVTVQDASDSIDATVQNGSEGIDVTVSGGADTRVNVSDDGTQVVSNATDIDFDTNLSVTDDGDQSVTVAGQSDEEIEDIVAALVTGGTNVTATYDDGADTLTIDTSALNEEEVEDAVAALLSAGNAISITYDDPGDTLTVAVDESALSFYDGTNLTADVDNQSTTTENLNIGSHEDISEFEFGIESLSGPGASSNNDFGDGVFVSSTVTFSSSFSSTPAIMVDQPLQNAGLQFGTQNKSASSFDVRIVNWADVDRSGNTYDVGWIAVN